MRDEKLNLKYKAQQAGTRYKSCLKHSGKVCVLFLLLITLLLTSRGFPQDAMPVDALVKNIKSKFKLNDEQARGLRPLIERQKNNLQTIARLNRDRGFENSLHFWQEMRDSRQDIENENRDTLTSKQFEALRAACVELEKQSVSMILDTHVALLEGELILEPEQTNLVREVLEKDAEKKHSALIKSFSDNNEGDKSLEQELETLSENTEKRLNIIFTVEQRRQYRMLKEDARRARVRLWGAIPSTGDLHQSLQTIEQDELIQEKKSRNDKPKKEKRGEFVIAPIPMINPTLENGLGVAVGYLFRLNMQDKVSPPSMVGGGGFKTSNGSGGFGFGAQFHLKEDRYRILIGAGKADVNVEYFGIGANAGEDGISIPLNQKGSAFLVEGLVRVREKWYVGVRYHLMKMKVALDTDENQTTGEPSERRPLIPEPDINLRTAAITPHILRDARNDAFYPTKGSLFDVRLSFFGKAVGGRRTYQSYEISYTKYFSLGKNQVLAARGAGCFVRDNPPFYDLCLLAQSKNLRGYEATRYRDRNMLAAQVEYRRDLFWRFGGVAFVGIGEVAHKFNKFSFNKILPGGGVGLRFRLTKQNKVNFRLDYAWGKDSSALYIGVTEAF